MGATGVQSPESIFGRYRKSSDVWSFGIILASLCAKKSISSKDPVPVQIDLEATLSPTEKENILSWKDFVPVLSLQETKQKILTIIYHARTLTHANRPVFDSIVRQCLFVEGTEDKNARGSFGDLICSLEDIRVQNGWDFDGYFSEDIMSFCGK